MGTVTSKKEVVFMIKQILRRTFCAVLAIALVLTTMSAAGVMTASANVRSTTGATTSNVTFIVPEVIYLKPTWDSYYQSTQSALQIFVNNTLDSSGNISLERTENSKGVMYFNYAYATSVAISFEWLNDEGKTVHDGTVTFGDGISRMAGTTYTATPSNSAIQITAGTSCTMTAAQTGAYLRWTAAYTDTQDNLQKTATAYTYVYKPYVQPVGVGIRCQNDRGSNHYGSILAWVSGVHDTISADGEWYPNANQDRYLLPISSSISSSMSVGHSMYAQIPARFTTDCGNKNPDVWINNASSPLYVPDKSMRHLNHNGGAHSSGDDAFSALEFSPTAALTVDTSRYGNLNQIPNLNIGLMVTDDEDSGNSGAWFISDYRGSAASNYSKDIQKNSTSNAQTLWDQYGTASSTVTLLDYKGTPSSPEGGAEGDGLKSIVRWNRSFNSATSSGLFMAGAGYYNHASGDTIWDVAELRTQITFYDKTALRNAVLNAIKFSAMFNTNFYSATSTEWKNYANLFAAASMSLTKVDGSFYATATVNNTTQSYSSPDAMATALNNAVTVLAGGAGRPTHTATQTLVGVEELSNGSYKCVAISEGSSQQTSVQFTTFEKVTFSKDTVDGFTFLGLVATSAPQSAAVGSVLSKLPTFTTAAVGATINSSGSVIYNHASNTGTDGNGNLYYTYYFKVNHYTVNFSANGGTGTMEPQEFTYNVWQNLSKNTFTRRAYTFLGWAPTGEGIVQYTDEQNVRNLAKSGSRTLFAAWEPTQYTITYDAGGGSLLGTYTTNYNIETNIGLPDAVKPGYTLYGWKGDGTDGWGDMIYLLTDSISGKYNNVTLRAVWVPISYQVVFNGNGATSGSMSNQSFTYEEEKALTANAYQRTGYSFAGWALTSNATQTTFKDKAVVGYLSTEPNSIVTLYAVWVPENYTLVYNPQGGTIRDAASSYTTRYVIADGVNLPAQVVKTGYIFNGWKPVNDVGNWKTSQNYTGTLTGMYGSATLDAQWSLETYTISYVLDGGLITSASGTFTTEYNIDSSVTLPAAEKTGYRLSGWMSDGAGNWGQNLYVTGGAGAGRYGTVSMTAQWIGITYDIAFSGNGSTGGVMYNLDAQYDVPITLPANEFSRNGYSFLGWSTSNNSVTAKYSDGATVSNLTTKQGETVTLYAVWDKLNYTITYALSIGKITAAGTEQYTATDALALAVAECRGYTFKGWTPAQSVGSWQALVLYSGRIEAGNYGTVTLNAQWEKNVYAIRYDAVGGKMSGNYTTEYSVGDTIVLPTVSKNGYAFEGWQASDAWDNIRITTGVVPSNLIGDVVLQAVWVQRVYTVRYNANQGTGSMEEQTMQFDTEETLRVNTFERLGYAFSGWALTSDATTATFGNAAPVYNLSEEDNGIVDLYAIWLARAFTITYNLNGGTSQTPIFDSSATMDADPVTLRNCPVTTAEIGGVPYEFCGWAYSKAEADAGTVSYENKASFAVNTDVLGKAQVNWQPAKPIITLYAVWKSIQVSLQPGVATRTVVDTESKLIYGLSERVSKDDLCDNLLRVNGKGSLQVEYQGYVGTGSIVHVYNSQNQEVETYKIIIFGDLDGDGQITTEDIRMVKGHYAGTMEITDPYRLMAGDLNGDGDLTLDDTILMKSVINGVQEYDQADRKVV